MIEKKKVDKLEQLLDDEREIINDYILSYSKIADFAKNGPKTLLEKTNVDGKKGVQRGSLIDDLIFSPDIVSDKYSFIDVNEPSSTLGMLCDIILENYTEIPDHEDILNIIKHNNFWGNVKKEELLIKKFDNEEFWTYLYQKFNTKDKIVVPSDEKMLADEIVYVLKTHSYSKHIFENEFDNYYQYKFSYILNNFKIRGILDIISVDHKNKIVYFKDLKTGSPYVSEFITNFFKYKYFIQGAIYSLAFETICKELNLEGYTLAPFEFVYISLNEKIPVTYKMTPKWIDSALNGFYTTSGYRYKGVYQLIEEIDFHLHNKIFDKNIEICKNNGVLTLNDDFIV